MLRRLGLQPHLCLCDNGSTDGTPGDLRALEPEIDVPYRLILNPSNLGNTLARNQIVEYALEVGADYLLMLDGDVELVPFSSFAMLRYLENAGHQLGALGANHWGCTSDRRQASPCLYSLDGLPVETSPSIAYTQYGLFRAEVFQRGVRFERRGPFGGPGWGFEDNDLAFEMAVRGYTNLGFKGMLYLHRDLRSSVRIMRAQGIDAAGLCERRKQFVIDKWAGTPGVDDGPLDVIRQTYISV
jgi:glycosyltransferase involved in cell wall biosynthesis